MNPNRSKSGRVDTDTGQAPLFRDGGRGARSRGTATGGRLGDTRTSTRTLRGLDDTQRRRIERSRRWRRVRRRAQGAWDAVSQSVTPLGWMVLALTATGLVLGLAVSWVEAWVVAVAGGL
ncbi:MAG: hypothetical protein J0H64_05225, partial [Actinobacteria bacterium]|nr:hypothetical protein [Actinomycetota bacterium]